ncbi:MAG: Rnf-Nqr domain containing protein [Spirochaetaceae bacterium]
MESFTKGLYRDNPLIAHLAGLAPALMVSTHLVYGFTIGVGMIGVTLATVSTLYPLRRFLSRRSAFTATLLIIATYVTLFQRILELINPYIREKLWIFLPILAVNCVILYSARLRGEGYGEVLAESLGRSLGYAGALLLVSVIRELLAFGSLTFSVTAAGGQVLQLLPGGVLSVAGYLAGGFMLLGYLRAAFQRAMMAKEEEKVEESSE